MSDRDIENKPHVSSLDFTLQFHASYFDGVFTAAKEYDVTLRVVGAAAGHLTGTAFVSVEPALDALPPL